MIEPDLSSIVSATLTAFIALLFARAVWHKLSDFTEFTGFVADYRVLPERLVVPASAAIVVAELAVIALQFIPALQVAGLVLAIAMLSLYGAVIALNVARGRDRIECGCGGAAQPLSWLLVGRNAVLAAIALAAVIAAPVALDVAGTLAALASGLALLIVFILFEQVLANASRVHALATGNPFGSST